MKEYSIKITQRRRKLSTSISVRNMDSQEAVHRLKSEILHNTCESLKKDHSVLLIIRQTERVRIAHKKHRLKLINQLEKQKIHDSSLLRIKSEVCLRLEEEKHENPTLIESQNGPK
jgi:hypothetical protein